MGASMPLYDGEGKEVRTILYGAEAMTDQNALAARVAADVQAIVAARPDVKVHCIQDAAPELRAMPEALVRSLPTGKSFVDLVDLVDIEHLCRDYLDKVVDACEPEGDPYHMKEWYVASFCATTARSIASGRTFAGSARGCPSSARRPHRRRGRAAVHPPSQEQDAVRVALRRGPPDR
jgi:hypothetical protein